MRGMLLLPLVLVAPALAGCGDDDTTVSAVDRLRAAGAATQDAGSAELTMTSTFEGPDGDDVEVHGEGRFDFESQRGEMTFDLPEGPGIPDDAQLQQVFDGFDIYMSSDALGELPDGSHWLHIDVAEATEDEAGVDISQVAGAQGNDPTSGLSTLEAVAPDGIEDLGEEDVGGTETTHYRAEIDLEAAYEEADAVTDRDDFEAFLEQFGQDTVEMEVWIDDEGRVRRQQWHQPTPTTPGETVDALMVMEFGSFGDPVDIEIPDDDDVMELDELLGQQEF